MYYEYNISNGMNLVVESSNRTLVEISVYVTGTLSIHQSVEFRIVSGRRRTFDTLCIQLERGKRDAVQVLRWLRANARVLNTNCDRPMGAGKREANPTAG